MKPIVYSWLYNTFTLIFNKMKLLQGHTGEKLILVTAILSFLIFGFKANDGEHRTHPWASFKEEAWADVHTSHRMVMTDSTGQEQVSNWGGDSRMIVHAIHNSSVTIRHTIEESGIDEQTAVIVPAIDEFPGTRALGQWPHDIFPFGPERGKVTPEDKNPIPENMEMKVLNENVELTLEGERYRTTLYVKEWDATTKKDGKRHLILKAWVAEGIALPLKWALTSSNGKGDTESELLKRQEIVKVDGKDITCMVTVTRKKLTEGMITKKCWTSTSIPGFMVKMESKMNATGFALEVNEHITKYSTDGANSQIIK